MGPAAPVHDSEGAVGQLAHDGRVVKRRRVLSDPGCLAGQLVDAVQVVPSCHFGRGVAEGRIERRQDNDVIADNERLVLAIVGIRRGLAGEGSLPLQCAGGDVVAVDVACGIEEPNVCPVGDWGPRRGIAVLVRNGTCQAVAVQKAGAGHRGLPLDHPRGLVDRVANDIEAVPGRPRGERRKE